MAEDFRKEHEKRQAEDLKKWQSDLRKKQRQNIVDLQTLEQQGAQQGEVFDEYKKRQQIDLSQSDPRLRERIQRFEQVQKEREELRERLSDREQGIAKRQLTRTKLAKKNIQLAKQLPKAAMAYAKMGSKMGTARALQWAWLGLIETFFLTLIYINIHFIFAYLGGPFSDFFCKFGEEWVLKTTRGATAAEGGTGQTAMKAASKPLEFAEIITLLVLDLIIGAIILGIIYLIYYLIKLIPGI